MAITVKHTKVSLIPDSGDDTLIEPSDWNADHELTGTIPVENGGTGASTLTGYVVGNGTLAMTASATIPNTDITGLGTASTKDAGSANGVATLDAGGKVPVSELPAAVLGALSYQGTWDASTNTPTLTSSTGTKGYYYVVAVAGSTDLDGITDWVVGDWAVFNGSIWQQIDNTDAVTSVNGQTGAVVLTTTDVAEGTNEYFTTARARTSISAGTGISYDNSTGVVTNSAPDQTVAFTDGTGIDVTGTYPNFTVTNTAPDQTVSLTAGTGISTSGTYPDFTITNTAPDQVVSLTGAGTTAITGTYPNFTITSNDEFDGDVVGPASATDNAIARFDSTTGKLIQNSTVTVSDAGVVDGVTHMNDVDYIDFDTTYNTTLGAGQLGWNGNDTLGLGMIGGNVVQHIGEDTFFYVKASATITKGQLCMFTGAVGSSGVLTAAPSTGIPYAEAIIGVAAEDIANNGFGLIQNMGTLKGVDTSAFSDGDILYYNSAVTGGFTNTFPTSGPIVVAAAVATAGSGGSGILTVRISFQTRVTASTGMSVSQGNDTVTVTNTAPDQVVSLTQGGTTTITGTYPNFTISSDDQYDGTVTSVGGTGTVNGLTLTGTVTTSGDLTLGGTLDLSSPPTIGNTTPNSIAGTVIQATNGIVVNSATISASYSIPSGSNAMSAGPITIADGVTVTVPDGNAWSII